MSYDAACLLAGMLPWPLEAALRRRIYERIERLKENGAWTLDAVNDIKMEEKTLMVRQWDILLNSPDSPGESTREAIRPSLRGWLDRKHGSMSFHLTQLLTGHGCIGHYLYRMRKRTVPECQHCGKEDYTITHILSECPA